MMKRLLLLLTLTAPLWAQSRIYGDRINQSGTTVDATLAAHTKPFSSQSILPATCTVGDWMYTPGVGSNIGTLSVCTATNTWKSYTNGSGTGSNATQLNGTSISAYSGVLKLNNGSLTSLLPSDITNLWTGTGAYLKADGTLGTPSGSGLTAPSSNGILKYIGSNSTATIAATDIISLFGSGACSGYLKSDGTCATPAGGGLSAPSTNGLMKYTGSNTTGNALATDVISLFNSGTCAGYLKSDGTCGTPTGGGSGTVTSVAAPTVPSWLSASITNATTTPAITLSAASIAPNLILAGPSSGSNAAIAARALVPADLPSLDASKITTGTLGAARLPVANDVNYGVVTGQTCNSGQHIVSIINGIPSCSNDTGGNGTVATQSGTLTARPAAADGSLYVATNQPAGQGLYYGAGSSWYQLMLASPDFSFDTGTGQMSLAGNIPKLSAANTFGSALQTLPNVKITTCVQGDGTTPCFGAGSNTLAVQQNSSALGNAATLNFGNGLNATSVSGGATNITANVWSVNGQVGPISVLPDVTENGASFIFTSTDGGGTEFVLNNANANSGGIHSWSMYMGTDGNLGVFDKTNGSAYMGGFKKNAVSVGLNGSQSAPAHYAAFFACTADLAGTVRAVDDSSTATFNAIITGGGSNFGLALCDGTNWRFR